jgi:hypothetical protein
MEINWHKFTETPEFKNEDLLVRWGNGTYESSFYWCEDMEEDFYNEEKLWCYRKELDNTLPNKK